MPSSIKFTKGGLFAFVKSSFWKALEISMLFTMIFLFGAIFSGKMYSIEVTTSSTHTRTDYDFIGYMSWDLSGALTGSYRSYDDLSQSSVESSADQGKALETFGLHIKNIFISAVTFGVAWYPLHWISWLLQTFTIGQHRVIIIFATLIFEAAGAFCILLCAILTVSGIGDFRDRFAAVYCTSQAEVGFCAEQTFSGTFTVNSVQTKWYPYEGESSAYLMESFACVTSAVAFIIAVVQFIILAITVYPALKAAKAPGASREPALAGQASGLPGAPNFGGNFGSSSVYGNPSGAYVKQ